MLIYVVKINKSRALIGKMKKDARKENKKSQAKGFVKKLCTNKTRIVSTL